jgi:hypothetical protein
MDELIKKYQSLFRILEKWKIEYHDDGKYYDQCATHSIKREAWIFPVTVHTDYDDYVFHEILHICQREIRKGKYADRREKEELFVQDLCKIMYESKNYKN